MGQHSEHPNVLRRLKKANGHLSKIISMIEEERACLDVAQQLQAVYSAVAKAKQIYVQNHIEECIQSSEKLTQKQMASQLEELKEITKYL